MHFHNPQLPQTSYKPKQSRSTYPQTTHSQSPTTTYHHETHQPTPNLNLLTHLTDTPTIRSPVTSTLTQTSGTPQSLITEEITLPPSSNPPPTRSSTHTHAYPKINNQP